MLFDILFERVRFTTIQSARIPCPKTVVRNDSLVFPCFLCAVFYYNAVILYLTNGYVEKSRQETLASFASLPTLALPLFLKNLRKSVKSVVTSFLFFVFFVVFFYWLLTRPPQVFCGYKKSVKSAVAFFSGSTGSICIYQY